MLVYLTAKTWKDPEGYSKEFAQDVRDAIDCQVPLILAHEQPSSVIGNDARDACVFDEFFSHKEARGSLPPTFLPNLSVPTSPLTSHLASRSPLRGTRRPT